MLRITLKSLWDHKRRLVSTLVAIVLGVAFMAGTFVLTDTLDQTFDDLFAENFAKVDAEVQGKVLFDNPFGGGDARAAFDQDVLDDVRAVDGVAEAEPFVIVVGFGGGNRVLDKEGDPIGATQGPPTLIESWYGNDELSPYVLKDGRGPEADREMALNTAAAEEGPYSVGDTVDVLTQFGVEQYELVGIVNFGTAKSSAGAVSAEFTLAEAQRLAGTPGQLNQVVAKAEDGVSQQELVDRIKPELPADVEVITGVEAGKQLSTDVQSGFQFFSIALQVFGGIALLVGVFVISNTFSILVAQRTPRAGAAAGGRRQPRPGARLGAARGQPRRPGGGGDRDAGRHRSGPGRHGGLRGLRRRPAGGHARGPAGHRGHRLRGRHRGHPHRRADPGDPLHAGPAAGRAARRRRRPLGSVHHPGDRRRGAPDRRPVEPVGRVARPKDTDDLPPVGFGALLVIVAAIVIGPVLAGPSIRLLGSALPKIKGITGRLAAENAARSPKRTSATASALLISVALVGFITVFASSAKASVGEEVSRGFVGDFVVQSESGFFGPPSGFPPAVAETVSQVDGVASAVGFGFSRTEFAVGADEFAQFLSGVDPEAARGVLEAADGRRLRCRGPV